MRSCAARSNSRNAFSSTGLTIAASHPVASIFNVRSGWSSHPITRSARTSNGSGIDSPKPLAVFRLTTSSNLVGW
jgi:hypothetical protein